MYYLVLKRNFLKEILNLLFNSFYFLQEHNFFNFNIFCHFYYYYFIIIYFSCDQCEERETTLKCFNSNLLYCRDCLDTIHSKVCKFINMLVFVLLFNARPQI